MRRALPVVLLLLAAGCQPRLNQEEDVQLESVKPRMFTVNAIAKEQVIKVSAKAASGTFNLFVFLEKDLDAAETSILRNKPDETKVLKHQLKTAEAELQATIPANETAVIYLLCADAKKAEVKLKITN